MAQSQLAFRSPGDGKHIKIALYISQNVWMNLFEGVEERKGWFSALCGALP